MFNKSSTIIKKFRTAKEKGGFAGMAYLIPCFLSLFLLGCGVRIFFSQYPGYGASYPYLFNLGWSLLFCGVIHVLPAVIKRIVMMLISVFYCVLTLVHNVIANLFDRFFSFADFGNAGDGAAFFEWDYVLIRKVTILLVAGCLLLMILAALMVPKRRKKRPVLITGAALFAIGVAVVLLIRYEAIGTVNRHWWKQDSWHYAEQYEKFNDSYLCMSLCGIYQYTFRDALISSGVLNWVDKEDLQELEEYIAEKDAAYTENEMTGIFEGKNLILVQLEAIDKWTIDDFMPNLKAVKEASIVFENHYVPQGGTFNSEFMALTGLYPAINGISMSVYANNHYPYSLPNIFVNAGYSAASYHHSSGVRYDRTLIHTNLGFSEYHSLVDDGLADERFDTELMKYYDLFTADEPFFSFIITISGHGPYNEENAAQAVHYDEAAEISDYDNEQYIGAGACAIETDEFIGQLMAKLEESGLLENTVVIFYADHYNYYMRDTELSDALKGTSVSLLKQNVDFFIYSKDIEPQTITEFTTSVDIVPTLANLFGLETNYGAYLGHDAFSDVDYEYVLFTIGTWYDGQTYSIDIESDENTAEIEAANDEIFRLHKALMVSDYFEGHEG